MKDVRMSKFKFALLVGLVVIVTACSGQAPATPTVAPTATQSVASLPPTVTRATPLAPPTAVAATPTQPKPASPPKLDPANACKASAGLAEIGGFPTSLPTDQSKGSDKAPAVLYEYSDFQ